MSESGLSKAEIIEQRKANLPLPDQPPQPSDWNSLSEDINVKGAELREEEIKTGGASIGSDLGDSSGLREPATGDSAARTDGDELKTNTSSLHNVGREAVEGLSGPPSDAVAAGKKENQGVAETRNKDYGYPEKSDPSSGL